VTSTKNKILVHADMQGILIFNLSDQLDVVNAEKSVKNFFRKIFSLLMTVVYTNLKQIFEVSGRMLPKSICNCKKRNTHKFSEKQVECQTFINCTS